MLRKPPPTRQEMIDWQGRLRAALLTEVTESEMRSIVGSLVQSAKRGDIAATKLLFAYVIGAPEISIQNAVISVNQPRPLPSDADEDDPTPDAIERETARLKAQHLEDMKNGRAPTTAIGEGNHVMSKGRAQ